MATKILATKILPTKIRFAIGCLIATWAFSCADDKADPCLDEMPPEISMPELLDGLPSRVASVTIDQWSETDADDNTVEGTTVGASFANLTVLQNELSPAMPFGDACFAEIGEHVVSSQTEPIPAGAVQFEGLRGVIETLSRNSGGTFSPILFEESVLDPAGGEEITVDIEAAAEENSFPSGHATVTTPPLIELDRFEIDEKDGIRVNWVAGGGTYFEVIIRTEADPSNPDNELPFNRLRCILSDDGCHRIPTGALSWLLSNGAKELRVVLKRHQQHLEALDPETIIEFDVTRSLDFRSTIE